MKQVKRMVGDRVSEAHVDMGYRGHDYVGAATVHIDKRQRGRTSRRLWRWMKRRAAVEPSIGHLKNEHRLGRNRLKGAVGDAINAILSAAGMNFHKLLGAFLRLILHCLWNAGRGLQSVAASEARQNQLLCASKSLFQDRLSTRVPLEVQPAPHAGGDLRHGVGRYGQLSTVTVQDAGRVLNSTSASAELFPHPGRLPSRLDLRADLRARQRLRQQHPPQNLAGSLLRYSLAAHRPILLTHSTCVIGMIILNSIRRLKCPRKQFGLHRWSVSNSP